MTKPIDSLLLCVFRSCYTERNTEENESQADWKDYILLSKWDVGATTKL